MPQVLPVVGLGSGPLGFESYVFTRSEEARDRGQASLAPTPVSLNRDTAFVHCDFPDSPRPDAGQERCQCLKATSMKVAY